MSIIEGKINDVERLAEIRRSISRLNAELHTIEEKKRELEREELRIRTKVEEQVRSTLLVEEPDWSATDGFPWSLKVKQICCEVFKFDNLRREQWEGINATLSGRNVFVVMKTGGGKSLIYQLPGILVRGISLIVMPLLSLIRDQVKAMNSISPGSAVAIAGIQNQSAQNDVYKAMDIGCVHYVFVTPEKLHKSKKLLTMQF